MANEGRWYAIEAYFDPESEKVVDMSNTPIVVQGSIDRLLVVQVPSNLSPKQAHRLMQQTQETLLAGGHGTDRQMVLVPDIVKLAKLRKLSKAEMAQIQAKLGEQKKKGDLH